MAVTLSLNPVSLLSLFSLLETRRSIIIKIYLENLTGLDRFTVLARDRQKTSKVTPSVAFCDCSLCYIRAL